DPREAVITPSGRILVAGPRGSEQDRFASAVTALWDAGAGQFVRTWSGFQGGWRNALSPDGRRLAVAAADGGILLFAVPPPRQPTPLPAGDFEQLWQDLAGEPGTAWKASEQLTAAGDRSVAWLRSRLAPASDRQVRRWLANLDADDFATRQAA